MTSSNLSSSSSPPLYAAVIGDVVKSRQHEDRTALQTTLLGAFESVNREIRSVHGFKVTLGDEFQGLYPTLGDALIASFRLRVELSLDEVEVRFGVGWGEVPVRDAAQAPFAQDGPGWWRAREALELVSQHEQKRGWPRDWRTAVVSDDPDRDRLVNAFLLCRDGLLSRMDHRDRILTRGLLDGEPSKDLASRLKIKASAVTQRLQNHGIYALLRAHEQIEELVK